MENKELEKVLKSVFPATEHFETAMGKSDIPEWDSIGHLNLILEIEDQFEVSFSKEEIESINSIENIENSLKQKIKM